MYRRQSSYDNNLAQYNSTVEIDKMHTLTRRVVFNLVKNTMQKPDKLGTLYKATQQLNAVTHNSQGHYSTTHEEPVKPSLLRYPAFPLENTMEMFLLTVKPFLNDEEMKQTEEAAKRFQKCEGQTLQALLEKDAQCKKNWLADRWLRAAYMQFRAPVTVYSSPGMTFPIQKFKDENDYLLYASKVVYGLAKYKLIIDKNELPVVKLGKYPLDNSQFGKVYGTCRIPEPQEDTMEYHPNSKHIVVIYKNHFYKLMIYNNKDVPLHPEILMKELKCIMCAEKTKGLEIGVLTTDNRNNWSIAYNELMQNEINKRSIKIIQSAMFTLSLDECVESDDKEFYNRLSGQLIHGGGVKENSANRWMDKTIQLIVNPNGMSGFCYEHSPAEGQPIANITDYVVKNLNNDKHYKDGACDDYCSAKKLLFAESECLKEYIGKSKINIDVLANNLSVNILHFKEYGKGFIKKQKLSPDSYVQMALQYAFYKLHKTPAAQYESAHLRIYLNGRTETIRSCSIESVAFAKAMLDECADNKRRVELLRKAINAHRNYTTMALQGKGVDRHLLGLKLIAIENKLPIPDFYKCPGYVKSLHFRMSTSQVATPNLAFMVYGPAVEDGYGCCYNPRENDMIFACSSWCDNSVTNVDTFVETLRSSFKEMQQLLLSTSENTKSKL